MKATLLAALELDVEELTRASEETTRYHEISTFPAALTDVALVVVGLLLVLMDVLPRTTMDPNVVLLLFLPILVFQGALSADDVTMRAAARPILVLAFPAVAVTLLGTAAVASWGIGLPFTIALLLGAILVVSGPTVVAPLLSFVRPSRRGPTLPTVAGSGTPPCRAPPTGRGRPPAWARQPPAATPTAWGW